MVVWSVLALVVLLGGIGILFAVYGRWSANSISIGLGLGLGKSHHSGQNRYC